MNTEQSLSTKEEMQTPQSSGGGGWRVALCVIALAMAFAAGSWFTSRSMPTPNSQTLLTSSTSFEEPVVIQISGQVKNPGVYELPFNSRVYQAISKAGGLLPNAETENINLADWVKDGSQIIVPAKSTFTTPSNETAKIDPAPETPSLGLDSQPIETAPAGSTFTQETKRATSKNGTAKAPKSTSKEPPKSPIDLNRAMSDELQQLPGVGPAMANRILQYRKDNRGFTSVDDLNNVNGIGPKKLEKIKPFAIVKPLPFQKQASN
jgi:competence protein ComEA